MKRTKRVLGLALAAVMCMGMLAGCGGTKNATNGTETSEKVLNIATIGETTTLSPLYMIADNRPTQKLLYEGLVKYVDGEIQPVLEEDRKLSDDGTQLTFYLRKGVTFHDGEPFNAEAAIANIESWHINPSFTSLPGVVNYTNIEAVDEYTIRLTYDTPYFAYYAATEEELRRTIRQLRSRIKKIAFAERGLSRTLPDYEDTGQLSLPLEGGDTS